MWTESQRVWIKLYTLIYFSVVNYSTNKGEMAHYMKHYESFNMGVADCLATLHLFINAD